MDRLSSRAYSKVRLELCLKNSSRTQRSIEQDKAERARSSKVPYIADQAGQDSVLVFQSRSFLLVEMVKRRNSFDLLSDNESEVLSELNG